MSNTKKNPMRSAEELGVYLSEHPEMVFEVLAELACRESDVDQIALVDRIARGNCKAERVTSTRDWLRELVEAIERNKIIP